ncbi:hypothetical protein ACLOJK_019665 [Asimina triloba]
MAESSYYAKNYISSVPFDDGFAQQTDAGQLTRSLLLVPRATVNVKPNLQIIADDVKCSHGAAISDLEEEQLFYFRTRGVDIQTARNALIFSFGAEVTNRLPYQPLRIATRKLHFDQLVSLGQNVTALGEQKFSKQTINKQSNNIIKIILIKPVKPIKVNAKLMLRQKEPEAVHEKRRIALKAELEEKASISEVSSSKDNDDEDIALIT